MPKLHILHFNDVYHLNPQKQEPVGGAARFATAVKQFRARYPEGSSCVLFSGDVFNPSVESSISKGKHMATCQASYPCFLVSSASLVPPMNQLGVDASCIGNHDFDFGVPKLKYLIQSTNFPWVLSNLVDRDVDGPAAGHKFTVLERSGMKIGILGLVEKEWLETISNLPPNLEYVDFVTVAKDLSAELRDPKGPYAVDLVIALTHCRLPNDIILAKECRDEIDLVLGGHDHFYYVGKGCDVAEGWNREDVDGNQGDDGVRLVKSGTDFRELSVIECNVEEIDNDDGGTIKVITNACVTRHEINSSVEEDPHMAELIEKATSEASSKMSKPVAYTTVEWDCRSSTVRLKESAIGNFIGDLMYFCYEPCIDKIDCALLCGGTIRSDAVYPPGEITLGNLLEIFPFEDTLCVIRITGQQLWDALESAVSMVPKQEGRFPVVSGLKIEYNPRGEPGHRLRKIWLTERRPPTPLDSEEGEDIPRSQGRLEILGPIDRNGVYTMCTRSYLAKGYDGYKALAGPGVEWLIDEENGILLSTLIRRYFTGLYYVAAMKFNKSCADRTRETVRQIADKWKQLASTKGDAIVKGHLSRESIRGSLSLSIGEKVQKPEEAKSVFMREWVTVAPVLEDRIVEVDY